MLEVVEGRVLVVVVISTTVCLSTLSSIPFLCCYTSLKTSTPSFCTSFLACLLSRVSGMLMIKGPCRAVLLLATCAVAADEEPTSGNSTLHPHVLVLVLARLTEHAAKIRVRRMRRMRLEVVTESQVLSGIRRPLIK